MLCARAGVEDNYVTGEFSGDWLNSMKGKNSNLLVFKDIKKVDDSFLMVSSPNISLLNTLSEMWWLWRDTEVKEADKWFTRIEKSVQKIQLQTGILWFWKGNTADTWKSVFQVVLQRRRIL